MSTDTTSSRTELPALSPDAAAFLARTPTMFIGGAWVPAQGGETLDVLDPSSGAQIATVPAGRAEDVDFAVRAARIALHEGAWPRTTPSKRAKLLWRLADLIDEHTTELAELESLDQGKPLQVATTADVPGSAETFRYMAGWATKIEGRSIPVGTPDAMLAYTRREPIGVVGQIVPWNFPLAMAAWKLAPALAAGCTVVLKPAEQTPLTTLRLGELIAEAGFPDGTVNIVTGLGPTVGAAIAQHPGIDKVAFTGSTAVGKEIVRAAAGNLKRVTLELGGKNPSVLLPDAPMDRAIEGVFRGAFANAGQVCTAGSRVYAHASVHDELLAALTERAAAVRLGPGLAPSSDMGPLVSAQQQSQVQSHVDDGLRAGARAETGGARWTGAGFFVTPTVFSGVDGTMDLVREEIFGPVVTVSRFDHLEDVVRHVNDTIYGLAAEVWTRDVGAAHWLAGKIEAGTVWINGRSMDIALPFGGLKQSGWGREKGAEGVEAYTQTKTVVVTL